MSILFSEPIAPDLEGILARHTDCDGIEDDFGVARELAEDRMKGHACKVVPGLTHEERVWTKRADWYIIFLLGADDPADCLDHIRRHAATWPCPYTDRYLAEVTPRLEVATERRAALRERREVAAWARREQGNPSSY